MDYKANSYKKISYKAIIHLVALFCFYACQSPKSNSQTNVSKKTAAHALVFKKEIHNFGKMKDGEKVYTSFYFRNESNKAITILGFKKSCGCITIKGPNKPILPNEEERITVTFDASGEWGKQMKTLHVNTSENHSYSLTITAIVENKLFKNLSN
ncbi:MAG: DUF1573 domain-containing protein [Prolixibacteraceae bacterium]|nr:DUF1573 domain-containing protein [Prolixibacteraceae bacterium]